MSIFNLIISILFYPFCNLLEILSFAIHSFLSMSILYVIIFILLCLSWSIFLLEVKKESFFIHLNNFEFLRLKWKETMYPYLSYAYPFNPFLSFFQSTILLFTITPILLNSYISIHLNPTLIHIYAFLSSTYLHLSFLYF